MVVEYKIISSKLQYFCVRSWVFKCFKNITNVIPINTEKVSYVYMLRFDYIISEMTIIYIIGIYLGRHSKNEIQHYNLYFVTRVYYLSKLLFVMQYCLKVTKSTHTIIIMTTINAKSNNMNSTLFR